MKVNIYIYIYIKRIFNFLLKDMNHIDTQQRKNILLIFFEKNYLDNNYY